MLDARRWILVAGCPMPGPRIPESTDERINDGEIEDEDGRNPYGTTWRSRRTGNVWLPRASSRLTLVPASPDMAFWSRSSDQFCASTPSTARRPSPGRIWRRISFRIGTATSFRCRVILARRRCCCWISSAVTPRPGVVLLIPGLMLATTKSKTCGNVWRRILCRLTST